MIPTYVINLDRHPDRMRQMEEIWGSDIIRVPAVDGSARDPEAIWGFAVDAASTPGQDVERVTLKYWQRTYGCYWSHIKALNAALDGGHDRFMILEDDARPRGNMDDPSRPQDGVLIWGGALKGGSYTTHHRRAADPNPPTGWHRIQGLKDARLRYQSHATEYPRLLALDWQMVILENPESYDISWWQAMVAVPTYVPGVEQVYQELDLGSARRRADKQKLIAEGVPFRW